MNVSFDALPVLNSFVGGSTYCAGEVLLDIDAEVAGIADYILQYTFNGAAQTITSTSGQINLGNAEGTYVLTNLEDANCAVSLNETQVITVNAIPNAPSVSPDATYCNGESMIEMIATGSGGAYTWYSDMTLTNTLFSGSGLTPNTNPGQTVYYVTESNNGCEGLASAITVLIENCEITIPTAFTPDGDLVNDTWEIIDLDLTYPNNVVNVYNRWGTNIYTSTQGDYNNNPWDGTYEGKALPVGSYYFIIDYNKEGEENVKGIISIILNK